MKKLAELTRWKTIKQTKSELYVLETMNKNEFITVNGAFVTKLINLKNHFGFGPNIQCDISKSELYVIYFTIHPDSSYYSIVTNNNDDYHVVTSKMSGGVLTSPTYEIIVFKPI